MPKRRQKGQEGLFYAECYPQQPSHKERTQALTASPFAFAPRFLFASGDRLFSQNVVCALAVRTHFFSLDRIRGTLARLRVRETQGLRDERPPRRYSRTRHGGDSPPELPEKHGGFRWQTIREQGLGSRPSCCRLAEMISQSTGRCEVGALAFRHRSFPQSLSLRSRTAIYPVYGV